MSHKSPKDRGSHSRHLWVGSFQNKVAAKDIAQYFEKFGPLENISVKDNYAFVNYRKISSAVKALEALNGTEILGSKVAVKFTEGVPTRMLWIGSLPATVTEQELKEKFQRFGNSFISARIFRKTNSATIHYGKLDDAKLAYKQSKNMELRGQLIKLDYGMEPERGKPKVRREHREGESDEEYNYRAEEGLDPNLRFTITIPNNDPPYDQQPPPETDMNMSMNMQQEQVDPQLLQQVVQSLLNSSGMPMDQSPVAGMMPDGVNGALPSLDPTFLAQLQDTISQAGLFNTANNLNALVSNTAMPDVSRFFPVEDSSNNRGRFYPTDEPNDRREEHRHGRDEDYYYDRERLIDRNLSRFYNNERDRNHSRDSHRNEPRGSSPPRPEPRGSTPPRDLHRTRSRSPSRRSRTPPRDAIQLSEEDLLVQARKAVEAGRKDRAEESRGQKRSSPDNISDRPEKRQKTSTDSTPPKTPTVTDKNKSTNSSESSKSDSLRKSANKSSGTNVSITVTANGPVDSTSAATTSAPSTTSSNTNASSPKKSNEAPKTSSTSTSSAQTSATKSAASSASGTTAKTSKTSSPNTAKATAPSNSTSSSKPTNGTAVSSNDTGIRMEVDSRSGSAPSVASSTSGSNSGTVANTTGGSGGAKSGSTTVGTSGTTAVSGSVSTTAATGSSSSPSVQGGGSVASTGGSVTSGQINGAAPASNPKAPSSAAPSGAPKAPTVGKATTAAPTAPKPVVFVPVKPEPVRNNTNATTQQQLAVAPTVAASTVTSVPQTSATSTQPGTTPTVVQGPSTSQSVQKPTSVRSMQSTAQPTAASLLGVPASEKSSPVTTSVSAPQTPLVSNTNQLPPTSNPLAPPGLPPVSSAPKSMALGFIKNMLEDNPVIPQPPSSPISPPRSPKRIDKPQVWHGYLAKRGTIVCDVVAYFLGGSELWRKLSPMLDLKERTNLTNLTNFFPTDNTIKPSLLYLQPASKGETFKYASIHRYLKNIEKAGICLGEEDIYRVYILPMAHEEALEFNVEDDMALFALIVPKLKRK